MNYFKKAIRKLNKTGIAHLSSFFYLAEFAAPHHGLLTVDLHWIQRIFIPLPNITASTRVKILDMIGVLSVKLSELLSLLVEEARRQDGSPYPPNTLVGLVAGIQCHLRKYQRRWEGEDACCCFSSTQVGLFLEELFSTSTLDSRTVLPWWTKHFCFCLTWSMLCSSVPMFLLILSLSHVLLVYLVCQM